jgi:hypothetical protein
LASRRIRRTKSIAGYLESLNQESSESRLRNNARSIASEAIGSSALSEEVQILDKAIQSENYAPGADGWRIDGGGNAEFGNVYVRGDINAYSGTIGYWNISNPLVERSFGTTTLYGTFLESFDHGPTDADATTGTYVAMFKSYFDDPTTFTAVKLESNKVTLTLTGHTLSVGDPIIVKFDSATYADLQSAQNDTFTITDTTPTTISYFLSSYNASGASDIALTDAAGTVQIFYDDVAGLYLRDYTKSEFDYGYFSNKGIKYVSAEDINILENPSFEYFDASSVATSSLSSWTPGTGLTLASQNFIDTASTPDRYRYDSYSKFGGKLSWTTTVSTALSAKLDWAVGDEYKIYENGRILYFGLTAFPYYDTAGATGEFSTITRASLSGTFTSGVATTETITYTGTGLTFAVGQHLSVTGFTGGTAARFNVTDAVITSASSTTVVVTFAGTAGTSTGTGTGVVGLLKLTFLTAHNLSAGDQAYLQFNAGYDGGVLGEITEYYVWDINGSTYDVLASPAPTSTEFHIIADRPFSQLQTPIITENLIDISGGNLPKDAYEAKRLALDLSQIKVRFPNNQTVDFYDVLTADSKAEWDAGTNKYLLSDPNVYLREFADPYASISEMGSVGALKVDADVLLSKYSSLDSTNFALNADIYLDFPGWLYKYTGSPLGSLVVSSTKVDNAGYILDNVFLSTSSKIFYGGSLSTVRWYATTEDTPSYSTAQASIEESKNWISIDLDTQSAYLNYFNYITFKPTSYTKPLYSPPSLGTTQITESGLPLVPNQNIEVTTLSSGKYQALGRDGTNYRSYEGFVKTVVGSIYSSSELQTVKETINSSGEVTDANIAIIGVNQTENDTGAYVFADSLTYSSGNSADSYEMKVSSALVDIQVNLLGAGEASFGGTLHSDADITAGTDITAGDYVYAQRLRLSPAVDLSTTSTDHNFQIGADSTTNLRIDNNEIEVLNNGAGATLILNGAGGGTVQFGGLLDSNDTYANDITTTRRAMWISSAGVMGYASSSRTKKQDIIAATLDPAAILSIEPKHFRYIKAVEELGSEAPVEIGMIAEDLHDAGLGDFVDYGASGDIEGIHYSNYVVALQVVVRDQAAKIAALTDRLDRLEGN